MGVCAVPSIRLKRRQNFVLQQIEVGDRRHCAIEEEWAHDAPACRAGPDHELIRVQREGVLLVAIFRAPTSESVLTFSDYLPVILLVDSPVHRENRFVSPEDLVGVALVGSSEIELTFSELDPGAMVRRLQLLDVVDLVGVESFANENSPNRRLRHPQLLDAAERDSAFLFLKCQHDVQLHLSRLAIPE
ncbi:hypothetical protein WR25_08038 [Diploscapter pachys]|uniref:Uncharacterized protein n=1 Tax=Diploscapter pachys TaxID=2018661 RepID=A0A2A2JDU5_9BILA|nr:hypothetical protein WR25_08038 [Diploscapter pachys]